MCCCPPPQPVLQKRREKKLGVLCRWFAGERGLVGLLTSLGGKGGVVQLSELEGCLAEESGIKPSSS